MSIFTKLTIRNLKLNKKRTIGTIVGIMLSVALICAVSGMVTSLRQSMISTTANNTGYYHLKLSKVTDDVVEKFKNNRDVKDVNVVNDVGYSILEGGTNSEKPYIHLYSLDKNSFDNMRLELKEGEYPKNSNEIAINEDILKNSTKEFKVGDKITLNIGDRYAGSEYINPGWDYLPYEYANPGGDTVQEDGTTQNQTLNNQITEENLKINLTKEFEIVGIISNKDTSIRRISYISDAGYACVTNGLDSGDQNAYIALKNPSKCDEAFEQMIGLKSGENENVDTDYIFDINYELLKWEATLENVSDSMWTMIVAVCTVTILIIIVTSVYCIKNAFSISLTEKIKMYGMLSSIGATKKQIKKSVIKEGMLLSLIGIPLGILSGIFAVYILTIVVGKILAQITEMKMVFSISMWTILISIVLGFITVYLSCLSAVRKSRKISPLEAIRNTNEVKIKSKKIKSPKIIKKLFGVGGDIAYKNLKRSRKKYRTTVVSIVISVFIFIATSSLITYFFKAVGGYYEEYDYNIKITSATNEGKELFKILENNKSKDCTLIYEVTRKNGNNYFELNDNTHLTNFATNEMRENGNDVSSYTPKIYILGLNDEDFKKYVEEMNLHYEEVKDKVILNDYSYFFDEKGARTFARYFDYREGDKISGKLGDKNIEFSIAKITEEKPRGMEEISYSNGEIILNIDEYKDIIDFVPTNLTINTDKPSELEENLKNNYKDVHIINLDEQVRFNNAVQLIISIFAYGFIVVITLIGVTNIFNTLTSNIELRQKEFAMLKSIGMTKKEFNRMVNLETVFYSFKALIYGIILGLIASFAIYKAFAESMNFGFIWPIEAMLISIIFVFIIVFIIMRFAIGKVNKQNIIETIRKENV